MKFEIASYTKPQASACRHFSLTQERILSVQTSKNLKNMNAPRREPPNGTFSFLGVIASFFVQTKAGMV